jgi:hypothetical protein
VEPAGEKDAEDRWYPWLDNKWTPVPPEKVVKDYAPDGQVTFLFGGLIQCFVRPKGEHMNLSVASSMSDIPDLRRASGEDEI